MIFGASLGLACFVAFSTTHLVLPRIRKGITRGNLVIRLVPWLCALLVILVVAKWLNDGDFGLQATTEAIVTLIWAELTFLGLFVLYMPFVYTITHSLSVITLIMIAKTEDGRLSEENLSLEFTSDAFLEDRLQSMTHSGYLTCDDHLFGLTPRGERLARIFRSIKMTWRLGAGG